MGKGQIMMVRMLAQKNPYTVHKNTIELQVNSVRQHGVVLFFSLIALVAMSLAAVALIRSVDTNNMIAGNLGFKQSTIFSSDTGIVAGMDWLGANLTILDVDSTANGYYASYTPSASARADVDANGINFDANGAGAGIEDSQGNTIRYIIHRLCDGPGPSNTVHCLLGPVVQPDSDKSIDKVGFTEEQTTVVYRITARVTGPKNTVSYLQTFVY